ncbi:MAG: FG-GAP repeat domain-containing protein, partial [Candidatus Binatia bacterium]
YNDTIFVSGIVPDAPEAGETPPSAPFPFPPLPVGANVPVTTWFRDSNLTQYGAHHHINTMGSTGSQATGQAAGAAGLVASRGIELEAEIGGRLTANEVKQLLTMTAEDVTAPNTAGLGIPDPAGPGWDQHFGYGRMDLEAAVKAVAPGTIPAEISIQSPPWFHIIDPDTGSFRLTGNLRATRAGAAPYSYVVEVASGIEPLDAQFRTVLSQTGQTSPIESGLLASIPVEDVKDAFPPGTDFTAPPLALGPPLHGQANVPSNQFLFTVRVRVTDANGNLSEDRRTLFLHRNPGVHAGWPKFIDMGGEAGIKMADLGKCKLPKGKGGPGRGPNPLRPDGKLELVVATSGGTVFVWCEDGSDFPGFPVQVETLPIAQAHSTAPGLVTLGLPRSSMPTPAVGDLDGDGRKEIVAAAAEKVYAWGADGKLKPGFPVSIDTALSAPPLRTKTNYVKTGIFASPALGNLHSNRLLPKNCTLDPSQCTLDVVVAAMDGRVYVWDHTGAPRPGFPVRMIDPEHVAAGDALGTESITAPTLADLDGDGFVDVVAASNEFYTDGFDPSEFQRLLEAFASPIGLPSALAGAAIDQVFAAGTGTNRIYAVRNTGNLHPQGPFLPGWPIRVGSLVPDALPLVGQGFMAAAADLDDDPSTTEVVVGATLGNVHVFRHDGLRLATMQVAPLGAASDVVDRSAALTLFEYPSLADLDGDGTLDVIKAGITANGAVNLLLTGQNLPYNHAILAWNARTGEFLPAFPKATDDYMLLGQPS